MFNACACARWLSPAIERGGSLHVSGPAGCLAPRRLAWIFPRRMATIDSEARWRVWERGACPAANPMISILAHVEAHPMKQTNSLPPRWMGTLAVLLSLACGAGAGESDTLRSFSTGGHTVYHIRCAWEARWRSAWGFSWPWGSSCGPTRIAGESPRSARGARGSWRRHSCFWG